MTFPDLWMAQVHGMCLLADKGADGQVTGVVFATCSHRAIPSSANGTWTGDVITVAIILFQATALTGDICTPDFIVTAGLN